MAVGGMDVRYPYTATENWQKTLGAHYLWIEADVKVTFDAGTKNRTFEIAMTMREEDRYNFTFTP